MAQPPVLICWTSCAYNWTVSEDTWFQPRTLLFLCTILCIDKLRLTWTDLFHKAELDSLKWQAKALDLPAYNKGFELLKCHWEDWEDSTCIVFQMRWEKCVFMKWYHLWLMVCLPHGADLLQVRAPVPKTGWHQRVGCSNGRVISTSSRISLKPQFQVSSHLNWQFL